MTLQEAFGPTVIIYKDVLITRVSSAYETTTANSISCTYDYIELDNGQTLRGLKVRQRFYELIDENFRSQTRTDLYVCNGELDGGLRSDGKMMLDHGYSNSPWEFIAFFGPLFFLGILWFGLLILSKAIPDGHIGGILGGFAMVGIGGVVFLDMIRAIRRKCKTAPFFRQVLKDNERQYRERLARAQTRG